MELYFCVGCRQVHYDNDYSKENSDLKILDWDAFLRSVGNVKLKLGEKK